MSKTSVSRSRWIGKFRFLSHRSRCTCRWRHCIRRVLCASLDKCQKEKGCEFHIGLPILAVTSDPTLTRQRCQNWKSVYDVKVAERARWYFAPVEYQGTHWGGAKLPLECQRNGLGPQFQCCRNSVCDTSQRVLQAGSGPTGGRQCSMTWVPQ